MRNYLMINGVDSRTYGVYISGQGAFSAPSRAYDIIPIPGRNGALIGAEKRFENIEVKYPAFIYNNFKTNIADFRAFLLSQEGYFTLSDSYNANEYRMAMYAGPFDPDVSSKNDVGKFDIVFNCKPQRFLTSGSTKTTLTANGTITNPTKFDAKPLLRVYGTGSVGIGSQTITITAASTYTDIDCEMQDCYKGSVSKNEYVSFSGNDFPVITAGTNSITLTTVTKVEITPRWWTV